jgi:hypothetical protein
LWNADFRFDNDPPINLIFDPQTDTCYYESSLSGDGGVLFSLDMGTGESTVVTGIWDSVALAFEPMSHRLYGIAAPQATNTTLWEVSFLRQNLDPSRTLQVHAAASIPSPLGLLSSLTFVPHTSRE